MIAQPRLLLADEPTGNLDQETGALVVELMFDLARRQRTAVVLITHDPALAARADRVLTMTQGELVEAPQGGGLMRAIWAAIRVGLLDMRGDMRRFWLLIACLAVGTALIAGVSSVGASIRQAVERDAAVLMGGDVELSRADRRRTTRSWACSPRSGGLSTSIDTNVGVKSGEHDAFADLASIGPTYRCSGGSTVPICRTAKARSPSCRSATACSGRWSIR